MQLDSENMMLIWTETGIIAIGRKLSFRSQAKKRKSLENRRKKLLRRTKFVNLVCLDSLDSFGIRLLRLVSSAVNIMSHH